TERNKFRGGSTILLENLTSDDIKDFQFLAGLFRSKFFSTFLIKILPYSLDFAINNNFHRKQLWRFSRRIFDRYKLDVLSKMLAPLDKPAFKIGLGDFQHMNINMGLDNPC